MNNILFYKNNSLPNPLDETHDGLWFIKEDSEEFYTLYVVSNGVAISEQKVKNTSELINDGKNGSSYYIEYQELLSILDGYLPVGYQPNWADIQNKPIEFPPSAHTHTINEIQSLNDALDKKVNENDLSNIAYTGDYEDLNNIPIEFPPSPHNHNISDINNLQNILNTKLEEGDISAVGLSGDYADLENIPSSFPPSPHNHVIEDIIGLEVVLESKLEEGDVANVALTGDYGDLINTPTIPVTSVAGKIGDVILTKTDVGLENVDNTSDLNKPISIATQEALDDKVDKTITVNGQPLSANVNITKTNIGLGNVDNTSDLNKPISIDTQSALDTKVDKSTTITGGGGIIIGGSLSSGAVSISINETYLNNKYLRNDIDDNNNGHTLTLGKLVTPDAEIENLNLSTLATGSNSDEILVVDSAGIVKKRSPANDVSIGVTNAEGTEQFSLGATDSIRFAGSGDTSINFNPATKTVTITSTPGAGGGGAVTSFNGRTGAVSSETGDYSTTQVTEGSNLYFTQARVRTTPLTGLSLTSSQDIVATDTVLQGLGKAQAQLNNKLNSSRSLSVSGTAGRIIVSGGTQDLTADREWQIDLASSGVTAGTYTKISVDTYGRVTTGGNLVATDIPNLSASKITSGVFSLARLGTGTAAAGTYIDGGTGAWTALPSYSAGSGLTLSGTTFSLPVTISGTGSFVQSVTQNTNGITVTLGTPPNTTYSTGSLAELNVGTVATGRLWGSNVLNSWLTGKLPTVGDGTLSISAGTGLTGSGSFSANQSSNSSISIGLSTATQNNINLGVTAHGWGNHASAGYLKYVGGIPTGADLNDYLSTGVYGINSTTAGSILNKPLDLGQTATLEVLYSGTYVVQKYYVSSGSMINSVYIRTRNSDGWNAWETDYNSSTIRSNEDNDARYLQLTGGTVTGTITAPTFSGALSGNATTATKLANPRTINGTTFNGLANITTIKWGTARTLTIGNQSRNVDGSINISWSLSEIGALPLTGGTVTGVIKSPAPVADADLANKGYVDSSIPEVIKETFVIGDVGGSSYVFETIPYPTGYYLLPQGANVSVGTNPGILVSGSDLVYAVNEDSVTLQYAAGHGAYIGRNLNIYFLKVRK